MATKADLQRMYNKILPYLGGMPEMVANKFSKGDLYSTEERMIGQWVDGKPVYQKTVEFSSNISIPADNWADTPINSNDIENIISVKLYMNAICHNGGSAKINTSTSKISLLYPVAKTVNKCTIQYTKTTDSPISIGLDTDYSTDEKIVGTWIDGKPLYQKTTDCGALPNATIKDVTIATANSIIVRKVNGISYRPSDGMSVILPRPHNNSTNAISVDIIENQSKIRIITQGDYSAFTESNITIQYTKTTD